MDISCIILAGGKSSRLGHDKVLETIGNRNLLEQAILQVSPLCNDIIIVTAQEQALHHIYPKSRVVTDIFPLTGPLGGIYSGLKNSYSLYNLVVACDMPFLNRELLGYLLQIAVDFDLVVPRVGKNLEPLHAVYARSCIKPIEDMIKQNNLSANRLAKSVKTRYVETDEIDRFDPEHMSFININTEADLEKARELIGRYE